MLIPNTRTSAHYRLQADHIREFLNTVHNDDQLRSVLLDAATRLDRLAAETAYRLQMARESFADGYAAAEADMAARWDRIARTTAPRPSHAELEEKRWGPGGRAHFADPRPGDYPGRLALEAQAEPEPELEIA